MKRTQLEIVGLGVGTEPSWLDSKFISTVRDVEELPFMVAILASPETAKVPLQE